MPIASDVVTPRCAGDVAAALAAAAAARRTLAIRGAGTKDGWGRAGARADAVLDMSAMNRVLAHEHGDMTVTVEAGATLRDVNRALAQHGQWLPLDPPFADAATIGGILATNDSGPLRHRYGTPRDLVIGVQLATADGVLSNAGGRVVKNVAGYDLGKLVAGSFGSLAAIVTATFKLAPIAAASQTLALDVADAASLGRLVSAVMASQLEPLAFELSRRSTQNPRAPSMVLLRFASLATVVAAQVQQASALLTRVATNVRVLEGDAERAAWRGHGEHLWRAGADASVDTDAGRRVRPAVVRVSWLPANIERVAQAIGDADFVGRAAIGAGLVTIDGDDEAQARTIERLRASSDIGNVVVVRASEALKGRVGVWGPLGDRQPLLASIKRVLDPENVLNPGRGPV